MIDKQSEDHDQEKIVEQDAVTGFFQYLRFLRAADVNFWNSGCTTRLEPESSWLSCTVLPAHLSGNRFQRLLRKLPAQV